MKVSKLNTQSDSYWKFCINKSQLIDWLVVAGACICSYLIIHCCYPYPATYSDSFSYIRSAIENQFVIFRPFGYSAYLRFIHVFSKSVGSIFISQTLLYIIASGLLIIALKKYYPVHNTILRVLLELAVVCSPVALYMLNAIMSDALFCVVIYLMIAMLIVVIMEKSLVAALLFLLSFYVSLFTRYSAMFFPIVFIPILLFHKNKLTKWSLICGICIVFGIFYNNVSNNMEETIGHRQFSTGFDSWQLANNAMCMLPYIDNTESPDYGKVKELHEFSRYRYDDLIKKATGNGTHPTAAFLWDSKFPLKQYLYYSMQRTGKSYPVLWARLGATTYSDYGKWLILKHPGKFWKHYLAPNIRHAFYPTTLEILNYSPVAPGNGELTEWFHYKESFQANHPFYSEAMKGILPIVELFTWCLMAIALAMLLVFKQRWSMSYEQRIVFWLIFAFGFLYYGSTVFATPIAIRYWMPMQAVKLALIWCVTPQLRQIFDYVKTCKRAVRS